MNENGFPPPIEPNEPAGEGEFPPPIEPRGTPYYPAWFRIGCIVMAVVIFGGLIGFVLALRWLLPAH